MITIDMKTGITKKTKQIIKILMNSIDDESPMYIPWNIWYYDITDLQSGTQTQGRQKEEKGRKKRDINKT